MKNEAVKCMRICGYSGTNEDLKRELSLGLSAEKVWVMPNGKGMYVEYTGKPIGADRLNMTRSR